MIDLNHMVERFLDEAIRQCRNDGGKEDNAVIGALHDPNQSTAVRRTEVLKWLRFYSVLQGLNGADRDAVAGVIIDFADARGAIIRNPLSEIEIIEKFNDLHDRCRSKVRLTKAETARNLTSLTSKALWCCYPHAIPIFDSYARRSLWVVSRLMGLDRPAGTDDDIPYARFVSVWLNLYGRVTIDDDRLGCYPYKVRVFDRILWIIGQPDYGQPAATAR